jgi:hypothetical protein
LAIPHRHGGAGWRDESRRAVPALRLNPDPRGLHFREQAWRAAHFSQERRRHPVGMAPRRRPGARQESAAQPRKSCKCMNKNMYL